MSNSHRGAHPTCLAQFACRTNQIDLVKRGECCIHALCRIYQPAADPDQARWLPGARLNIGACALGCRDPDAPALLWAEEEAPTAVNTVTLGQLRRQSEQVAAALQARNLQPGADPCQSQAAIVRHPFAM